VEELRGFYRGRLKLLVLFIVVCVIGYRFTVEPRLLATVISWQPHVSSWASNVVKWLDSALAGLLFLGGEWLIRKRLWRFERPDLDFSGEWFGISIYETMEVESTPGAAATFQPFVREHSVRIEQDCFDISIATTGQGYLAWGSLAMTFITGDPKPLRYVYEVNYGKTEQFPRTSHGYEEMKVAARRPMRFGREQPIRLTGEFYHCTGQKPAYSGSVIFRRVDAGAAAIASTDPVVLPAVPEVPAMKEVV